MYYFGTNLRSAGHYFWELYGDEMRSLRMAFDKIPFNPEELLTTSKGEPRRDKGESLWLDTIKGYSILAIEGSCSDGRLGTCSVFFIQKEISYTEFVSILQNTAIAQKILKQMPFKINDFGVPLIKQIKMQTETVHPFQTTPNGIKDFRTLIDCCLNSIRFLRPGREIALVNTHLQRSFSWLGKALEFSGSQTPYTQSENAANTTIEPVADHTEENNLMLYWQHLETTQTTRVKHFRSKLQELINHVELFRSQELQAKNFKGHNYIDALKECWVSLIDAKMWLGWELGRIKKEKENIPPLKPVTDLPL